MALTPEQAKMHAQIAATNIEAKKGKPDDPSILPSPGGLDMGKLTREAQEAWRKSIETDVQKTDAQGNVIGTVKGYDLSGIGPQREDFASQQAYEEALGQGDVAAIDAAVFGGGPPLPRSFAASIGIGGQQNFQNLPINYRVSELRRAAQQAFDSGDFFQAEMLERQANELLGIVAQYYSPTGAGEIGALPTTLAHRQYRPMAGLAGEISALPAGYNLAFMANGGIVTEPTAAIVGERGPEMVMGGGGNNAPSRKARAQQQQTEAAGMGPVGAGRQYNPIMQGGQQVGTQSSPSFGPMQGGPSLSPPFSQYPSNVLDAYMESQRGLPPGGFGPPPTSRAQQQMMGIEGQLGRQAQQMASNQQAQQAAMAAAQQQMAQAAGMQPLGYGRQYAPMFSGAPFGNYIGQTSIPNRQLQPIGSGVYPEVDWRQLYAQQESQGLPIGPPHVDWNPAGTQFQMHDYGTPQNYPAGVYGGSLQSTYSPHLNRHSQTRHQRDQMMGGNPLNMLPFAGLAGGGKINQPMMALVGEEGPELAMLQPGDAVIPLPEGQADNIAKTLGLVGMANGGGDWMDALAFQEEYRRLAGALPSEQQLLPSEDPRLTAALASVTGQASPTAEIGTYGGGLQQTAGIPIGGFEPATFENLLIGPQGEIERIEKRTGSPYRTDPRYGRNPLAFGAPDIDPSQTGAFANYAQLIAAANTGTLSDNDFISIEKAETAIENEISSLMKLRANADSESEEFDRYDGLVQEATQRLNNLRTDKDFIIAKNQTQAALNAAQAGGTADPEAAKLAREQSTNMDYAKLAVDLWSGLGLSLTPEQIQLATSGSLDPEQIDSLFDSVLSAQTTVAPQAIQYGFA